MADKYGNWLGVLKWSLVQQDDGTRPSSFQPMSEENKRWLTKVFKSMTVDEAGRMKELADVLALLPGNKLSVLSRAAILAAQAAEAAKTSGGAGGGGVRKAPAPDTDSDDSDDDEDKAKAVWQDASQPLEKRKLSALEELDDLVSSADNAKNLFAVGAFPSLMQVVLGTAPPEWRPAGEPVTAAGGAGAGAGSAAAAAASEEGQEQQQAFASLSVQARAAEVLSTVLQNNPAAQTWSLQSGCLHGLVTALTHATIMTDYCLLLLPSPATLLHGYLHLQTALVGALSALTRHNGQAQAALVAGINLSTGADSAVVMTMPAFEVDIEEGGSSGSISALPSSSSSSPLTLLEAAKALRRHHHRHHEAKEVEAGALHVSPFHLVTHPLHLWPLFSDDATSPLMDASARSKGRRLVRKCLFFLQHFAQGGVNPDEIKAALLNIPSDPFAWLPTLPASSFSSSSSLSVSPAASTAGTGEERRENGAVPWLLRVLDTSATSSTSSTEGDAVHCRESALTILLALSQKSEKGVDVKDETERRKPVSGFTNPSSSSSSGNPFVASVPTAAATMIEERRRLRQQREEEQPQQQPQQQTQGDNQAEQQQASTTTTPVAGLLMPPPPNYDADAASSSAGQQQRAPSNLPPHRFVTTVAVPASQQPSSSTALAAIAGSTGAATAAPAPAPAPAAGSSSSSAPSAALPSPSLTLPQRLAILLKSKLDSGDGDGDGGNGAQLLLVDVLEAHAVKCSTAAEALTKKAAEAPAAAKAGDTEDEASLLRDQAEILSNEAELAQSVIKRLKTAAMVMRAMTSGSGGGGSGSGGSSGSASATATPAV